MRDLVITGRGGVPSPGLDAMALNVIGPKAFVFTIGRPAGTARATASELVYEERVRPDIRA